MKVAFLANVCIVSDQTSEAGNVKYCPQLHARSGLRFIIRLQEDAQTCGCRGSGPTVRKSRVLHTSLSRVRHAHGVGFAGSEV